MTFAQTQKRSSGQAAAVPRILAAALLSCLLMTPAGADPTRTLHTTVELIAEVETFAPGTPFDAGLRLTPDPGWHTYWINPGDAGQAARLTWDLPDGFTSGELQFPAPGFVPFMGLMSYGYNEETLITTTVEVPEQAPSVAVLSAFATWLVCDDKICIPESADIRLELSKGDGSYSSDLRAEFATARARHPVVVDWLAEFAADDEEVTFKIGLPDEFSDWGVPYVFPVAEKLIDHAAAQKLSSNGTSLFVSAPAGYRQERVQDTGLVLQFAQDDGRIQAFALQAGRVSDFAGGVPEPTATSGEYSPERQAPVPPQPSQVTAGVNAWGEFLKALLFALLGGLILNLMPCVLPILSLKALSVVEMSRQSKSESRWSGVMYAAGVLTCFLAFALILASLRAAGDFAGWAFHLQDPLIVSILSLIMVAVGLNFLGVFELSGTASNWSVFSRLLDSKKNESFFTGLLAVIVASPCTVPFMAGALGYAVVQPMFVMIAIFLGLGVGFSLPFLAISFVPGLHKALPKPGEWMNSMRRILAFPMLATSLWLLWILGQQAGIDSLVLTLAAALALGFALWCWGVAQQRPLWRWWLPGWAAVALCGLSLYWSVALISSSSSALASENEREQEWSEAAVASLRDEGRPVFAYFTADWCITCKVNERIALKTDTVQDFFETHDIAVLVGDWTTDDPDISAELERRGRAGVPVYLYWSPGGNDEPLILPSLLSPQIVIDALTAAGIN